jgi:hypothetical protein
MTIGSMGVVGKPEQKWHSSIFKELITDGGSHGIKNQEVSKHNH